MKTPWFIDACNEYLVDNLPDSDYNQREEISQMICQIIERDHIMPNKHVRKMNDAKSCNEVIKHIE